MPPKTSTAQLDRLEQAILGNGHEGLLVRTARIEESLIALRDDVKVLNDSAVINMEEAEASRKESMERFEQSASSLRELVGTVKTLAVKVDIHHSTQHLAELLKKPKFYAFIFFGFIVLHIVSTYVPGVLDFGLALVGLPKLPVPVQ